MGRRRPFILYGSICTIVSFFIFGWSQELASIFPVSVQKTLQIWLAVVALFGMDFSVNVVAAAGRCLVVDSLRSSDQPQANAYMSRFSGAASIISLMISYVDLPRLFNTQTSQLKQVIIFSTLTFGLSQLITFMSVRERRLTLVEETSITAQNNGLVDAWVELWRTWSSLKDSPIRSVFWVQLWAWIGWFPLLFYSTTWIGEIWNSSEINHPNREEEATRIGSFGLLSQSIVSFFSTIMVPRFVSKLRKRDRSNYSSFEDGGKPLIRAWLYSQLVFSILLGFNEVFSRDYQTAIAMVGLSGFCLAISGWVPFALLGEMITEITSRSQDENNNYKLLPISKNSDVPHSTSLQPITTQTVTRDEELEEELEQIEGVLSFKEDHLKSAGTILGIHNTFIVIPQFIISLISSILFRSLENSKQSDGIGMIFLIGSLASAVSVFMCWKLIRKVER
ncbi:major facilitator superfamily domain-containing protein [Phakopsora pachyrhizi]|nr:major facilitator superfamily domain-containing protein [Phakopsora pachyrhizi]